VRFGEVFAGPGVLRLRANLNREPDIFFVSTARLSQIGEQYAEAPIELVIEVASTGTEARDLEEKRTEYEAAGIEEYRVVDGTAQRIVVHSREKETYHVTTLSGGRLESSVVPGFWIQSGCFLRLSLSPRT
jgi:Uma2 family endonuclease